MKGVVEKLARANMTWQYKYSGVDDKRGVDCGSSASRIAVIRGRLDGVGELEGWGGRRRRDESVGWRQGPVSTPLGRPRSVVGRSVMDVRRHRRQLWGQHGIALSPRGCVYSKCCTTRLLTRSRWVSRIGYGRYVYAALSELLVSAEPLHSTFELLCFRKPSVREAVFLALVLYKRLSDCDCATERMCSLFRTSGILGISGIIA